MDSKYIPAALKVLYELVCAFDSIQKEGVFHRDVKPYNVVVQDDGRVKVIDFDLATFGWFEEVDDEWTFLWKPSDGVGSTYGTDGYMSPEAIDHRKHYDSSSEAFSLGITMLETLLRKHPFAGMNNFDAVLRIIKGEVPTLSEERFGKELSDLVANTLLVDRELRYDVDALKFYLGKLMKNRGLLE